MSKFVQIHMLASYPPANVNRDDLGRPKTALLGGKNRLRISSQCLKRTWRTSKVFQEAVGKNRGFRTKELGKAIKQALVEAKPLWQVINNEGGSKQAPRREANETDAEKWAGQIIDRFGDVESNSLKHSQLVFVTPEEIEAIDKLLTDLVEEGRGPKDEDLNLLRASTRAVDVAMFGRMMADTPQKSIEGAVQVGHALSTHEVVVENDYFSAVEDLNQFREDAGAAHLGNREFASGLFYLYGCVNRSLLLRTLGEEQKQVKEKNQLAQRSIAALIKAMATETPPGMKNSYGSSTYASYVLVEKGENQPRNLSSLAFIEPVKGENYLSGSIKKLEEGYKNLDKTYKTNWKRKAMNVPAGRGSLDEVAQFAGEAF